MAAAEEKAPAKKTEEGEAPEGTPAPASKGKSKMLLFGGIGAAVVVVAVVVIVVLLSGGKKTKTVEQEEEPAVQQEQSVSVDESADEMEENEEPIGAMYPLESFVVNLKGGGYLRTQIQLEFSERDITPRFFVRQVQVRDGIITLLSSKTQDELSTPEGKDKLKSEIKDLVNEVMKKQEIKRVYFTQFVVQ